MTKRKFKKLLMAGGLQRNEAAIEAAWMWKGLAGANPANVVQWARTREPQYRQMRHGAKYREYQGFRWVP